METVNPKRRLGQKGARTRLRLLTVTREMLGTLSPVQITAAAITQGANLSPGTFYLYFRDVQDILYSLAVEAHEALTRLYDDHPEWFRDNHKLYEHAEEFVHLSDKVWTEYRHILLYRNLEADRGNERFRSLRIKASRPILDRIATAIKASDPAAGAKEASARAVVLLCALDRICAIKYHYDDTDMVTSPAELSRALARIMAGELGCAIHSVAPV